jgi:hypothetical protein
MMTLILVGTVGLQMFSYWRASNEQVETSLASLAEKGIHSIAGKLIAPPKADLPDIYYISLESYARQDVLQQAYGIDNQAFVDFLTEKGFVVEPCLKSNFPKTILSVSSTLNMDYIFSFASEEIRLKRPYTESPAFMAFVRHSSVRQTMEDLGYQIVTIKSGYRMIDLPDADVYYSPENMDQNSLFYAGINSFEGLFINTILVLPLRPWINNLMTQGYIRNELNGYYNIRTYQVEKIMQVPDLPGPKFVFVHMMATHDPFVINAQGEFHAYPDNGAYDEDFKEGYSNVIQYTNRNLELLVDKILAKSGTTPIIVLQGDHAFRNGSGLEILNAYFLPEGGDKLLYPTITPVNTFRVIFDQYFGGHLELLPDESFALGNGMYGLARASSDVNPNCR